MHIYKSGERFARAPPALISVVTCTLAQNVDVPCALYLVQNCRKKEDFDNSVLSIVLQ